MNTTLLVLGGIAVLAGGGITYYIHQKGKGKKTIKKEDIIDSLLSTHKAEEVEKLSMSDVVFYFRGLQLKKGIDVPFITKTTKEGSDYYLLAIYNEETEAISNSKLLLPKEVDKTIIEVMRNEKLVALS